MTIRNLIDELRAASDIVGPDAPVAGVINGEKPIEFKVDEIAGIRSRCVLRASKMGGEESSVFFGKGTNGY